MKRDLALHGVDDTWTYAGGELDMKHYEAGFSHLPIPAKQKRCLCGRHIVVNYFISPPDKTKIEVVGIGCVKLFAENVPEPSYA